MKRLVNTVLVLVVVGAAAVIFPLTLLWGDHNSEVTLPPPGGHFPVARATSWWHDGEHEAFAWIWYPAEKSSAGQTADYLPPDWRKALTTHRNLVVNTFLLRDPARIHSHSLVEVPLSAEQPTYPVVILRGGLGALVTDYTTLAEDLASHGFVVVGFDVPRLTSLVALPDGRIVVRSAADNPETLRGAERDRVVAKLLAAWVSHVRFAVDRLEQLNASAGLFHGRLNLQALGVSGHSLGGATAAQFCQEDSRCRAAVNIDGAPLGSVVTQGLRVPFMFLLSDHSREHDPATREIAAAVQDLYNRVPRASRTMIAIRGAQHFSFSDQLLVRPPTLLGVMRMAGVLQLEPRRGLTVAAEYLHRFFDVHLKGAPPSLLKAPSPEYPEAQFDPDIEDR